VLSLGVSAGPRDFGLAGALLDGSIPSQPTSFFKKYLLPFLHLYTLPKFILYNSFITTTNITPQAA